MERRLLNQSGADARPGDLLVARDEWTQVVIADPSDSGQRITAITMDMFSGEMRLQDRAKTTYNLASRP